MAASAKNGPVNDFKKLNKMVLKNGATEAKANRAYRANFNASLKTGQFRDKTMTIPNANAATFGRPNRPQTPVGGIIHGQFHEEAESTLQNKYAVWKEYQVQAKKPAGVSIRMTNAQLHADQHVRQKNTPMEVKQEFKLKRFQNVEPRTSTKRGDQAFMVQKLAAKAASSTNALGEKLEWGVWEKCRMHSDVHAKSDQVTICDSRHSLISRRLFGKKRE